MLGDANKIVIIGNTGSGKTTFAKEVSRLLNIPIFHLDKYFWKEHWVARTYEERRQYIIKIIDQENWVIEGNYVHHFDEMCAAADLVIFLDIPKYILLWKTLRRQVFGSRIRPDLGSHNRVQIDFPFIRLLWWTVTYNRVYVKKKLKTVSKSKRVVILRTFSEQGDFLKLQGSLR